MTLLKWALVFLVVSIIAGLNDYVANRIFTLAPDVVIPMHCTGRNFIAKMRAEMPDRLIDWNTGSRFTFGV